MGWGRTRRERERERRGCRRSTIVLAMSGAGDYAFFATGGEGSALEEGLEEGIEAPPEEELGSLESEVKEVHIPATKDQEGLEYEDYSLASYFAPKVPSAETVAAPPPVREEEPKKLEPWKAADAG